MSNAGTYPGHADTILNAIGEVFDKMQCLNGQKRREINEKYTVSLH
jgi:hypothetical protein